MAFEASAAPKAVWVQAQDKERHWMEKYMELCRTHGSADDRLKALKARTLTLEEDLSAKAIA